MPIIDGYNVDQQVMKLIDEVSLYNEVAPFWVLGIVLAESGGDPTAHNFTGSEDSVGLLQLNRMGGQGTGYSVETLLDPRRNLEIGVPRIANAVLGYRPGDPPSDEEMHLIFTNSGHPGRGVPIGDARIQRLIRLTRVAYAYYHGPPPAAPEPPAPAGKVTVTLSHAFAVQLVRDFHVLKERILEALKE